jgi:phosphonate degradation associated HDIG domain protein
MLSFPEETVTRILAILGESGRANYFGESVTQLQHALQCGHLARESGAEPETIAAALLHDIGHLIHERSSRIDAELGVVNHERVGRRFLRSAGFPESICELVGDHVNAKRYLTFKNQDYYNRLSEASRRTLHLQGGPMTSAEAAIFEADYLFNDKLRLRGWDDQAKRPDWHPGDLGSYRSLLVGILQASSCASL